MSYCPDCGADHHAGDREAQAAADREIEIERLRTERDIKVARIQAGVQREELETVEAVAEVEAEAEVASAVATAEVIGEVIATEAGAGDGQDDGDPPVIVEVTEPESDPGPEAPAPPELEPTEPETKKAPGWWDAYR